MTDPRYEMLWDCAHCGTRKNLGVTHRHCPECGAVQDAAARYFPSDAEKVAVEDHPFVGADLKCVFCGQLNGAVSKHCGGCGGPLEQAGAAVQRSEQVSANGFTGETIEDAQRDHRQGDPAVAVPANSSGGGWSWKKRLLVGCMGLMVFGGCALLGAFVFWKRDGAVQVAGQTWRREIKVERFGPVQDSAWCDQLPAGARVDRRAQEVRSERRVEDGQDCRTRRIDNGDGTFSERQECTPKYRNEPVRDDKCYYTINRWAEARALTAQGGLADPPAWPAVVLTSPGECVGCEREGARVEAYELQLVIVDSGEAATCAVAYDRWRLFTQGGQYPAQLGVIGGGVDCDSLRPQ